MIKHNRWPQEVQTSGEREMCKHGFKWNVIKKLMLYSIIYTVLREPGYSGNFLSEPRKMSWICQMSTEGQSDHCRQRQPGKGTQVRRTGGQPVLHIWDLIAGAGSWRHRQSTSKILYLGDQKPLKSFKQEKKYLTCCRGRTDSWEESCLD